MEEDPGVATVGEGGEEESGSKSVGQGSEGCWVTWERHAELGKGLWLCNTMTAVVFSLEEGALNSPPADSSLTLLILLDHGKSILGRKKDGTKSAPFGNQAKEKKEGKKEKLMEEGGLDKI